MTNKAIETLYIEHYTELKAFAFAMCQNNEDAEDIVSEVFCEIVENAGNLDISSPKQYLYRAVHNRTINHYKANKSRNTKEIDTFECQDIDCEDYPELHKALSELPDRQAMAIWLKYWKNMSYEDIAIEMECTVAAVEGLLDRAKNKLRELMHGC